MPSRRRFAACFSAAAGLALIVACKSPQSLPSAQVVNTVDTVTLYALSGTAPQTPSAYALIGPVVVSTALSSTFDFAFDIDSEPVLLPSGTFPGLPNVAALQRSNAPSFAALTMAPTDGYINNKRLVIGPGMLVLVRSATFVCTDGTNHSLFGKLHILDINFTARTVQFEVTTDHNCGYLGLAPGLPEQ
jgi:hypothetical protein